MLRTQLPLMPDSQCFCRLLSASLRRTTLLLFVIWFVNALLYYGLVLLTTELQSKENQKCEGDNFDLEKDQYFEIFIDTIAEFVGFSFAFFTIETLGRKRSLVIFMSICSMAMWPLIFSENDIYQTTFLFIARASIVGSFNVIYVYTPELFPTDVRAFGLGVCSALSRLGGLVAPLFAVQLVDEGLSTIVELLFSALCIVGAIASSWIPIETMGRALQDTAEVELSNVQSTARIPSDEEIQPL